MQHKPITEIGQKYPHAIELYEQSWERIDVVKRILHEKKDLPKEIRTELGWINRHAMRYAHLANREEARLLRSLAATARGILSRVGGQVNHRHPDEGASLVKRRR